MAFIGNRIECMHCGRLISRRAKECQFCLRKTFGGTASVSLGGNMYDQGRPTPLDAGTVDSVPAFSANVKATTAAAAVRRYRDAYATALNMVAHGHSLKAFAIVLAVIMVFTTLAVGVSVADSGVFGVKLALPLVIVGAVLTAAICAGLHGQGVRLSADGQHLLAQLDVAVHTSPFLTDADRIQAMSLT